jgi:hypothetical protein
LINLSSRPKATPFRRDLQSSSLPVRQPNKPKISSFMQKHCEQPHPHDPHHLSGFSHSPHTPRLFSLTSATYLCAEKGKPRTKPGQLSGSSALLVFSSRVLESRYMAQLLCPCGFSLLIHSSTHNEYYYFISIPFHGPFLEAFSRAYTLTIRNRPIPSSHKMHLKFTGP